MIPKKTLSILAIGILLVGLFYGFSQPGAIVAYSPSIIVSGVDYGRTTVDLPIVGSGSYETGEVVTFSVDVITEGTSNTAYNLRLDKVTVVVSDGLADYTAAVYTPLTILNIVGDGTRQTMVTAVDVTFTLAGSLTGDTFNVLIYTQYSGGTTTWVDASTNSHLVYVATPFAQLVEVIGDPDDPLNNIDNDSLPDDWEMFYFGDLDEIGTGDPDSDFYTNYQEYLAGTDPTVFNSGGVNPDPDDAGITIYVKNNEGDNVQGATVTINPGSYTSTTDSLGKVHFNVPDGSYTFTVTHNLYYSHSGLGSAPGSVYVTIQLASNDPPPPPPVDNDIDNDGLPDDWEMFYFGDLTQNASMDYDNDGKTNLQEYQERTDPTDGAGEYVWAENAIIVIAAGILGSAMFFAFAPFQINIKAIISIIISVSAVVAAHLINTGVI